MTKLNQIIAIEKGIKSRVYGEITELNKSIQKPDLFNGISREYQSNSDDGGDKLPAERKRVQLIAREVLSSVEKLSTELFNVTAKKDWTNTVAKADVIVDGNTILKDAPTTHLLFLEKQLADIHTFVGNLPVLDEAESWTLDENSGLEVAAPIKTHRTKKVMKPLVLYPATPEHPAQTQLVAEDVIEGYWTTTKQSGAIASTDKKAILARVEKLTQAVKQAREAANVTEVVETPAVGEAVFSFIFDEKE